MTTHVEPTTAVVRAEQDSTRTDALVDALRALRILLSVAAAVLVVLQPDSSAGHRLDATFIVVAMVLAVANLLANLSARSALDGKNGDDRNQHDPAKRLAAPLPDRASRFRHAGQGT